MAPDSSFVSLLADSTYGLTAGLSSSLGAEWFGRGPWHESKEGAATALSMAGKSDSGGSKLPCSPWVWQYLGLPAKLAAVTPGNQTTAAGWLTQPTPWPDAGVLTSVLLPTHQARCQMPCPGVGISLEQELALSKAQSALMGLGEGSGQCCSSARVLGTRSLAQSSPWPTWAQLPECGKIVPQAGPLPPASPICLAKVSASPTFLLPSYSGPGLQLLEGCSHFETLKCRAD